VSVAVAPPRSTLPTRVPRRSWRSRHRDGRRHGRCHRQLDGERGVGSANGFTYNQAPGTFTITPNFGPIAGGNIVTINGTNLNPSLSVSFANVPATGVTITVTGTQFTAIVPAGASATAVDVQLSSTMNGTASLISGYTYNTTPSVASINPPAGPQTGNTLITITGQNFRQPLTVTIVARES